MYSPFCMNICQWGSCVQSRCSVCSQSIKNNASTIQRIVLQLFQRNKEEILRKYVSMDEIWIHHFTPESNRQSAEWTAADESRPNRPKMQISAGKVLASGFWDILFIDYLEKWRTINSKYIALLARLKEEIAKIWPQMKKENALFQQDNAPCHKSIATMAKLHELPFELLLHPPYSLDVALDDYWLFADLKRIFQGERFGSNEKVILGTEA